MNCEQDVNPVHFLYADGLRKSKVVNGEKTIFFNDGQNVIIEADGSYNLKAIYTLGLGYIRRTDAKNNKYYYLYDAHGDVTVLTDSEGNIVKSYKVYGQYFDEESGLYYLRAGYYSPEIMRFISEDTYKGKIGNPATLNLYAYCGGNPVMLYDPSGNSWETLLDIAGAIVSLYDFVNDPTWANAGYLVWDIAAVIAQMVPGSYVNDIAKIRKLDDGMNLVEYGDEVLELAGGESI